MKRKIALALVWVIISSLLLTGCPVLPFFPGYSGVKSAGNVEDVYNNYIIADYLSAFSSIKTDELSAMPGFYYNAENGSLEDYPKIIKSSNEDNFHEAVKKCEDLQDIGFELFAGYINKSSNTLIASMFNEPEVISCLLENGADPNAADNGVTPLMVYANFGMKRNCDLLIENGADINLAGKYGLKPIDCALISGNTLEFIQYLVEKGATVDETTLDAALYGSKGARAVSALSILFFNHGIFTNPIACYRYENIRYVLQQLLEKGQKIDLDPALQAAIMGNSAEAKKILKKNREKIRPGDAIVSFNSEDEPEDEEYIKSILESADTAVSGPLDKHNLSKIEEVLDRILRKKADAEQFKRNLYLNHILFNIAAYGNLKDMEDIMEKGPRQFLGITNGLGLELIYVAIQYNNMENVKYLLELDQSKINEALGFAAANNNLEAAKYLMEKGGKLPDSNAEGPVNPTYGLPLACLQSSANGSFATYGRDETPDNQSKCVAMLEFLKQNNFIYKDSDLDEAVYYAAAYGERDVLEYLLKNYGTPRMAKNALHDAVDVETIKLLQQYGADILENNKGAEYVVSAAKQGNYDMLQYFLSIGADPNGLDNKGKTPLYHAIENGKLDRVKLLVENGAQVSAARLTDYEGNNMMANIISVNGSNGILDCLIANGYDINAQYKGGETPMTELVYECIASYEQGGKYNPVATNQTAGTLIWNFVKEVYNESEMGQNFSLAGFDNSEEFNEAWNGLMHKKYLERIQLLLKYKADPAIENVRGKSAYDIANEKGFDDIAKLFDDAGYKDG